VNAVAGLPILFLADVDIAFGGTLASLIGWIPMVAFIAWLVWTRRLPVVVSSMPEINSENLAANAMNENVIQE
jgi:hypothetical protein